ncbi:hypothetical protein OKW41_006497 [Paraburkholderia sp. UCT70]
MAKSRSSKCEMTFSARQPRRLSATVRDGFSTNVPSATSTATDRCRQRQAPGHLLPLRPCSRSGIRTSALPGDTLPSLHLAQVFTCHQHPLRGVVGVDGIDRNTEECGGTRNIFWLYPSSIQCTWTFTHSLLTHTNVNRTGHHVLIASHWGRTGTRSMLLASKRDARIPCLAFATTFPFTTIRLAQAFTTMRRLLEHRCDLHYTQ